MPTYPSSNDREFDLLRKIAVNTAELANTEAGDVASIIAGTGIGVSSATGNVTVSIPPSGTNGYVLTTTAGVTGWAASPTGTLPSQTGNTGGLLTTDGVNASWTTTPTATSLTAPTSTALTLTGGSTGASLVLGQGTNGEATFTVKGTGQSVAVNHATLGGLFAAQRASVTGAYFGCSSSTEAVISSIGAGGVLNVYRNGFSAVSAQFSPTGNLLIGTTTDMTGSGGLKIAGTTAATTTTSGALIVAGGVGVSGAGYFGGLVSAANYRATSGNLSNATSTGILDFALGATRLISYGADASTPGAFTFFGLSSDGLAGAARFQISTLGQAALASTAFLNTASWRTGSIAIGPDGQDKVVIGPLISTTNGPTIGGHVTGLGGWAPINVNGSTVTLRIGESAALSINASSVVNITSTTPSVGSTSGALQVAGGIYAGAASVFGGTVSTAGTITATLNTAAPLRFYAINGNAGGRSESAYQTDAVRFVSGAAGSTNAITALRNKWFVM
jgi:hypothetical protein